jgi:hypothetical protein
LQCRDDSGVPADAVRARDLIDAREILIAQRYPHAHPLAFRHSGNPPRQLHEMQAGPKDREEVLEPGRNTETMRGWH